MRRVIALLLAASAPLPAPAVAAGAPASPASTAFAALSANYLDSLALTSPVRATQLGDHRHDDAVDDLSAVGRSERLALAKGMLAELGTINRAELSPSDQVDAALLGNALRYDVWDAETLQSWAWNPEDYNETAGSALYALAARDFAPWPVRLRAATARMEKLPALFEQARANLVPARVPLIHAQTVAKQTSGVIDIVDTMLAPHLAELSDAEQARFKAAASGLRAAVATHQAWIDKTLVPNAKGDFRLGATLYDRKLEFALNSPLTRAEIKQRATAALAATRAQMYAIARTLFAGKPAAP